MTEDEKSEVQASDSPEIEEAGSAGTEEQVSDPSGNGNAGGESGKTVGEAVPKKEYEAAQALIGKQGKELGDLRGYFERISPLMRQLEGKQNLISAILENRIDEELAAAVLEGKVSVADAEKVTAAHEEVKESMSEAKYDSLKPEDIEKLVSDKLEERLAKERESFTKGLSELEERQDMIKSVERFANSAPDFEKHAEDIYNWLNDHRDVYDISVAYEAVVGRKALESAMKDRSERAGEEAKRVASNAGGGSGNVTAEMSEEELIDSLIGNAHNPNLPTAA